MSKYNVPNPWRTNYDYGEGFFQNMKKYKSVQDFLKKKRRKKRAFVIRNIKLGNSIDKNNLDFEADNYSTTDSESADSYINSIPGSINFNKGVDDFECKKNEELNYGRDYVNDLVYKMFKDIVLNSKEPSLFGLQDGIIDNDDEDFIVQKNNYYGMMPAEIK